MQPFQLYFIVAIFKDFFNWESMAGFVIQATGTVEFEDRDSPNGLKWPAEGPHYTWGSTRGSAHTRVPPGAD